MLAIDFSYLAFISLRQFPSLPTLLRVFNHEQELNFVKCFFYIYWDNHVILILYSVNVVHHSSWFAYVNHLFIPGINSTLLWGTVLLMCCWILFGSILLKALASIFIRDISLWYSFLVVSFWLWYEGNADLIKWVWKYTLFFNFWEEFEKDWC